MNTPYDTGKVKIGIYYQKPLKCEMSKDMELIQGALLGDNSRLFQRKVLNISYIIVLLGVIGALLIY